MLRLSRVFGPSIDLARALRLPSWWDRAAAPARRTARFDPRTASDHLKRDIGFMDGRRIGRGK